MGRGHVEGLCPDARLGLDPGVRREPQVSSLQEAPPPVEGGGSGEGSEAGRRERGHCGGSSRGDILNQGGKGVEATGPF